MPDINSESLPLERISGLNPEIGCVVGEGFAREDIKALLLSQGYGFVGDAVLTVQELCIKITGILPDSVLAASARQEVLKFLFAEPRIVRSLPELNRMRRQRNFFRRLDTALQSGRMTFAHAQEEEVYEERLVQLLGPKELQNPVRKELRSLTFAYEAWLQGSSLVDLPVLIRTATQTLREGWPSDPSPLAALPVELISLAVPQPESLEREFWEVLGQHLKVRRIQSLSASPSTCRSAPEITWQRWHTLDDAAEALTDQLVAHSVHEYAILIPDIPAIRRSLRRALDSRGLTLADPRDPTRLRWDEGLKWALLPLEVVGRGFERESVLAFLRRSLDVATGLNDPLAWANEINERGIRQGLESYAGGKLADVHAQLLVLETTFKGRKTCAEWAACHVRYLRDHISEGDTHAWLLSFLQEMWKNFEADWIRIGQAEKKVPLLSVLERFQSRLSEASPPVERLKPREGIRLYRLQQAPVPLYSRANTRIWIFGMPSQYLEGEGLQSFWFTERERDTLSSEFAVRSSHRVREERIQILKDWISGAEQVVFLDAHYDSEGREIENLLPALRELSEGFALRENPDEMGAHPRFTKSYSAIRPPPAQELTLLPLTQYGSVQAPELTATEVDRASRCSFQALAYHRWKLRDLREPTTELWPDVRGNLLHEAVRILLKSVTPDGDFRVPPQEALDIAWGKRRPKGLIQSDRIESYLRSRLLNVLHVFCDKERDYLQKSGARPVSLENLNLRLDYPGFSIVGQPDRVDQNQHGLFIMDYKTSGTIPHGTEMIEQGYRLQLPFYAVALRNIADEQPVVGVQFIELDRKGGRKSGIFFKQFNGKESGKFTQARANSKSLVQIAQNANPNDTWDLLEESLIQVSEKILRGQYEARPRTAKREKECARCPVGDLCGLRRLVELGSDGEGEASSE